MVTLVRAMRDNEDGILGTFLAETKEDTLPTTWTWRHGKYGSEHEGQIRPGSICITPSLDVTIMANDGTWGAWV